MRAFALPGVLWALLSISTYAYPADDPDVPFDERVWSYTAEEIYDRADAYKRIGQDRASREQLAFIKDAIKAAEFKGYVAHALDEGNRIKTFNDCARRLTLSDITRRAAAVLTSTPLDRASNAAVEVATAILFGCDDSNFKKP
jgi:hypothetical protein